MRSQVGLLAITLFFGCLATPDAQAPSASTAGTAFDRRQYRPVPMTSRIVATGAITNG